MNTKHKNHEENHTKAHHNQIAKTSDKEKTLQVAKEKKAHYIQRSNENYDSRFLVRINTSEKTVEQHL